MAERVLFVDDEECLRDILPSMLKSAGYECQAVSSGPEALALLRSGERFDVISSDVLMPTMDGFEFLAQVKVEFPSIPVIMVSAVSDPEVALLARRNGAVDHLQIPCERDEYLSMIRKALDTRSGKGAPAPRVVPET